MEKVLASKIQLGIYIEEAQNEKSTKYNLPFIVELNKDIDVDKFVNSLKKVIESRKILSSKLSFDEKDNNLYLTYDGKNIEPKIIKTTKIDIEKVVRKFNLLTDNLARFEIYKTDNGTFFFQDVHHIICDGTTINEIFNDIEKAYDGKVVENEKCDFFKFLGSVKDADEKKQKEEYEYYDNILADIDTDNLVLRDKYEETESENIISKNFDLKLDEFLNSSKDKKISKTSFFLTAFTFLLCKYNATKSIISNTIYHGRDNDTTDTYGMFIKTNK